MKFLGFHILKEDLGFILKKKIKANLQLLQKLMEWEFRNLLLRFLIIKKIIVLR